MSQITDKVEKDADVTDTTKLLVICIDRDNDVGDKAGIVTPVIGRDACIEAAQRLALEDPEDADSNSIFSAIKTYEDLVSRGYQAEVTVIAGVESRGVQADEKILKETNKILEIFPADGAVIVSDGDDDESVIPVIQNVLPIVSVQRVVMRVSRTVEYSYAVFGKYLQLLAYDPKYSKFFLGVPGILLLIGGIATVFDYTAEIFAVLVSIVGGALLLRAFDIDRAWSKWAKPSPMGFIRLFTMVTGIILMLSSIPAGIDAINPPVTDMSVEELFVKTTDQLVIGQFVGGALPILWIGIGAIFTGTLLSNWIGGVPKQVIDILRIVVLVALYPTIAQFANILIHDESSFTLIPPLIGGLIATLVSAIILFKKYRRQKEQEMISEDEEDE